MTHVGYKGKPVPSRAADFAEIRSLASVLREVGRGGVIPTLEEYLAKAG